MKFNKTHLKGAYVIELEPLCDERGFFVRTFCKEEFVRIGHNKEIVQINHSATREKGTIRGLHYQTSPVSEIKIIRCIRGAVFDVMVDIRVSSLTFGKWFGQELSKENMCVVYIPEGFAHGFQTLTDNAELIYHHSAVYCPDYERGLRFDDPVLAIQWPLPISIVSPKDRSYALIDGNFKGIEI
jgi:dTDP-4-dehydrorhamnose 3,5-epimerase